MRSQSGFLHGIESTFLNGVVQSLDPKCFRFSQSIKKDFDRVWNKETCEIVSSINLYTSTNIPGGKFVATIKHEGTKCEILKARFVEQVPIYSMKSSIVHDIATVYQFSTKTILIVVFIKHF